MVRIIVQNINTFSDGEYESFRQMISKDKLERIDRFKHSCDYKRSLLADVISRKMTESETGIPSKQLDISVDEFGKPFVKNAENIFFNVSHAGDYVACIISDKPCGIDIEEVNGQAHIDIAKRFFNEEEYNYLLTLPEENQSSAFFELWTAKEAYTKYLGKGIVIGLDTFILRKSSEGFDVFVDGVCKARVITKDIAANYILSFVCDATFAANPEIDGFTFAGANSCL